MNAVLPRLIFNRLAALTGGLILLLGNASSAVAVDAYQTPATAELNAGVTVTLNRPIDATDGARIHIQNGQTRVFSDVRQLDPYCYFLFNRSGEELKNPLALEPGRFPVIGANHFRNMVMLEPVQYALLPTPGFGGGGTQYTLATQIDLSAPPETELRCLVCAIWASPRDRGFLSFREIEATLGDLVTIGPVNQ